MKGGFTSWGPGPQEVLGLSGEPDSSTTILRVHKQGGLGADERRTNGAYQSARPPASLEEPELSSLSNGIM